VIDRLIRWSVLHPWVVVTVCAAAAAGGWHALRTGALDAIPDLSDTQVILFADWMGNPPDRVESQVTRPVVASLVGAPKVKAVRGYSMYGMSFIYVIFDDGVDSEWARARVQESTGQLQALLPADARVSLGPDASGVGWAYQYTLVDEFGDRDLAQLRELQDTSLRFAIAAVPGVAEVASIGGYQRQVHIDADPARMAARGVTFDDLAQAIQTAASDAAGSLIEMSQREYFVRVLGSGPDLARVRSAPLRPRIGETPLVVGDVASVQFGPAPRRGTADFDGRGEAVGGIVVVRSGQNTLAVIDRVKARLAEVSASLPEGVKIVAVYDRTNLIRRAVETLTKALSEQLATVVLVIFLFLLHLRSTLVAAIMLPAAVLLAFVPMKFLGVSSNLMSLGGIALAIGDLVDAAVVLVDDAHRKLEKLPQPVPRAARIDAILQACRGVGPPIFFSLLLLVVSFLPVFALEGQGRRLFHPLAFTKTFAMGFAAILSITLAPALIRLLVRGRITREADHPVSRAILRFYRPMAWVALHNPKSTLLIGAFAILSAIPVARGIGSEFMPALGEGDILYMPTTANGISITEAQRALQVQDRVLRSFPEVINVFGKAGKADTATDPAPLSMIETVVQLKPRDEWRTVVLLRWWHGEKGKPASWIPGGKGGFVGGLCERLWPSQRPITMSELAQQMQSGLDAAGWTHAWTMPIKARIDMLSTGIRTPVGIKVYGKDIEVIDAATAALQNDLKKLAGTRSAFAERNLGQWYVDVEPDPARLVRYGLVAADVRRTVETALAGRTVATLPSGRLRVDAVLRVGRGFRQSVDDLGDLPIAIGSPRAAAPSAAPMGGMAMAAAPAAVPAAPTAPEPFATVRIKDVATVAVREGPPMLKNESGQLAGYVYVDIDAERTDIGAWVAAAKARVPALGLPEGTRLEWTGQYEFLIAMQERMRILIPLTLGLMIALLWMNFGNLAQPLIVLGSVPFALVGSVWLLGALDYKLSTAVWVGLIALVGVAAETAIVMLLYLDEAYLRWAAEGRLRAIEDIRGAVLEGAVQRVRPKLMTVSMNIIGLLPVLWADGTGAEVTQRICAPLVGGLVTSTFLTLEIIPVIYVMWRTWQWRARGGPPAAVTPTPEGPATPAVAPPDPQGDTP